MKIDSTTPSAVSLAKSRQPRQAVNGTAAGSSGDSSVASLKHAQGAAQASAPVNSERVAEIRQAIVDGKLQINAERIADRLIEGAREQLAKAGKG